MNIQDRKFEAWKHGLLDVSRRNKLMNYRKTHRATLQITVPEMSELYRRLNGEGQRLVFRKNRLLEPDAMLQRVLYLFDQLGRPIELAEGELRSDLDTDDMQLTLKNLSSKALLAREEQGINILYASFGFLKWRQRPADDWMLSPLVLVPVSLEKKTITSPYSLKRLEEDIVVNPTLEYVLETGQYMDLPDFDPGAEDLDAYLDRVEAAAQQVGWSVVREANLGLLSFLKIVMYRDLEKNYDRIFANPVIRAFCGDPSGMPQIREQWENYDHDGDPVSGLSQVVGADASQKDAILLSRHGVSFVLQGPPGTGKSQTITNIIAQAMADGKKVLFVSQKMAALSVVYRRLEEAGLADYCLSLHDYKAEKRAVLGELVRTLDAPRKNLISGADTVFSRVEQERSQLNDYVREMTLVREPLGRNLFEVVTELSELDQEPFYTCSANMQDVSAAEYDLRLQSLERYVQFMQQYHGEIGDNPWRGTVLTKEDPRTGQILFSGARVEPLCAALRRVTGSAKQLEELPGREQFRSFRDFETLCSHMLRQSICSELKSSGEKIYGKRLSGEDAFKYLSKEYDDFCSHFRKIVLSLGNTGKQPESFEELQQEKMSQEAQFDELASCGRFVQEAAESLGEVLPVTSGSLEQIRAAAEALMVPADLKVCWFRSHLSGKDLKDKVRQLKDFSDQALKLKKRIDEKWTPSFYFTEESGALNRFRTEYTSIFKKLGRQYREEKKQLVASWKGGGKLSDAECISGLENLKEYRQIAIEFYMNLNGMPPVLGLQDQDIDADWAGMLHSLEVCGPAEEYINTYDISEEFARILEQPRSRRASALIGKVSAGQLQSSGRIESIRRSLERLGNGSYEEKLKAYTIRIADLDAAFEKYQKISAFFEENGKQSDWASLKVFGNTLETYLHFFGNIRKSETDTENYFAEKGLQMQDEAVQIPVGEIIYPYISKMLEQDLLPQVRTLTQEDAAEDLSKLLDGLMQNHDCLREQMTGMEEFCSWFPQKDFAGMPLADFYRCAERCRDTEALSGWLQYAQLEKECEAHDLREFLKFADSNEVELEHILPAYRRAFLTKWMVDCIAGNGLYELYQFNAQTHENTITDYRKDSDTAQSVIRARLIEQLSGQKPSGLRQMAGAMDEISILRKEAGKKSRIMPLRRLFKTIPGLLKRLKPCFMMSPLSVAYFLDSNMYDFDMVIFDEASQILPEDAVGAVYRGQQAIIAGDTKQLPPTTFFASAGNNAPEEESEDDDEYYPDVISESLLDEANSSLPQCTLLWHYRSRDESLIAFSNRQLYENRLITFPNNADRADSGLEYIFVEDGVYEGSGKNRNVREAEKCVQLLEEHILKHPDRSLGIVAFSEKQQTEIENAVGRFRMQHLEYEDFFNQTKDEPFFVKNLENVQGDERDTIFFSICYAKNAQGRMYQRFGPLSAAGGERRLNVAITRAKHNVKLIGSIQPSDIIVKEETGAGVRLLQEYITYAMRSSAHIPQGTETLQTGESFADDVAAYIAGLGYRLRRNIGESECKIDIGIVNPNDEAEYIAGIECDGPHYHFTRTAHDRDVLRRSVLKSMGWNLHHVWALSWFMKPEEEKNRLKAFLEAAMTGALEETRMQEDVPDEDDFTTVTDTSGEIRSLQFEPYQTADPTAAEFPENCGYWERLCVQIASVLDVEQPIHKKELYKRMCPVFGALKVTPTMKTAIECCLDEHMQGEVSEKNEFLYLTGTESFVPRRPADGAEPREIEMIAPEEIRAGICLILQFSISLGKEELLRETARQFGYAQAGPKIRQRLDEELGVLMQQGIIANSEGRLHLESEG